MRSIAMLSGFLLWSLALCAQVNTLKMYHIGSDEGLPTDNIDYVYQDSYGFLWMASFEGLIRWDGHTFKQYKHAEADSTSLSHNIVYCVLEDSQRRLWIGTIRGLNLYDREKDRFISCQLGRGEEHVPVNAIREDSRKRLWLGTSFGLCQYTYQTGKADWFYHQDNQANTLSHDVVFGLSIDRNDNVWAGTFNGGLSKFSPENGQFTHFRHLPGNPATLCSNKIKCVYVDHEGNIWAGSFDNGISVLDPNGRVIRQYPRLRQASTAADVQDMITSIYEDKSHTIWVATGNDVVYSLDRSSDTFRPFESSAYKKPHVRAYSVTSMNEDSFGNLWFSTRGLGTFYTNRRKNAFRYFYQQNGDKGLRHNVVVSLHEDAQGRFWVGTDGGGLAQYHSEANTFAHFTTENGLSSNAIMDIQHDRWGKLWLATWSGGLVQFDPVTHQSKVFVNQPHNDNSLPYNNLKSVLPDDTLLWIGTHGEGLAVFDLKNQRFIHHRNNRHFPFDMRQPAWINHLFKDSKNRIWVSTYGGLYVYDRRKLVSYRHTSDPRTLSSSDINMVTEDDRGNIWIVSESGGLDLFEEASQSFVRYSDRFELPRTFKAITTDAKGRLWLSSNEGLIAFDPDQKKQVRYDASDGLQGNFFFLKSVTKTRSGELAFGGTNGFNLFYPDSLQNQRLALPVYLTDLFIFDEWQRPGREHSPLNQALAFTDTLVLQPNQSFFTLGFAALDLYSPHKIRYAYQMEGLHDHWMNAGTEGKAAFTNLQPGTYRFRVRYASGDDVWQEAPHQLTVVLLPPWWATWWFRLVAGLVLGSSVIGFFYLRLASVRKQNRQLEAEVARRTHELRETNAALTESHEEVKMQNERLEEYNREITRQTDKILKQQEQIVTQNVNLEQHVQELDELNHTKDRFFSILAHDLKNPVQALLGHASYLRNALPNLMKSDLISISNHIYRSTNSVYELLNSLLDWAKSQSEHQLMAPKALSLEAIVKHNVSLAESQWRQKYLAVEVAIDPKHGVFADAHMVDTIVRNLLSNSIKFTPPHGRITLSSEAAGDGVRLTIRDTGVGMNSEQLANLFRLDQKRYSRGTAGETGTGLGMIIIREFLDLNGGSVEVESAADQGTTVRISLPRAQEPIRPEVTSNRWNEPMPEMSSFTGKAHPGWIEDYPHLLVDQPAISEEILAPIKGKRVLIVDDNQELRAYLRLFLSGTLEIFEAADGQEGLEKAADCQPALIICDMRMPVMDGTTFCRNIKENTATSHIPVILLTSQCEEESQLSGYEAGAEAYLTKPIRPEMLFRVIHNFILNQEKIRQRMRTTYEIYLEDASLNKVDTEFLNKVTTYIEANLSEQHLDAEAICELTALSRTVLYAKLKAITGQGVHEFIRTVRLKNSIRILLEGLLSVSQVAYEVGFNSPSHYVQCFTKQYGLPPKEYTRKLKEEKI